MVMGALRTISAVFRTAAGLDRQQGRDLHFARIEVQAVDALGVEDEFRERQIEQRLYLGPGPVVAHHAGEATGETRICCRDRRMGAIVHDTTMAAATGKCKLTVGWVERSETHRRSCHI